MKILGREPVYLLGFIAALLQALSAFGVDISDGTQTAINALSAAAVGAITAVVLKTGALASMLVQFAQAVMALCVGLGLDWSADHQSKVMAAIAALITLWLREKVTAPVPQVSLEQSSPLDKAPSPRAV
ncbi:hypothetical protein [Streptomyces pseudovenezuelae]|uniref:hypothetical protein n=1 Tax=Streptomyces pseudovenezuelae TaxID=67350 RepID=UPI002E801D55|nr:hypothetical protein [Streptomyces pseudovenezuelae]WUA94432.1 hypothetical protein OHO81_45145 [Streptomyces pseudovenezuelae]